MCQFCYNFAVLRKISLISISVILFAIAAFIVIKLSDKISIIQTFIPEKIAVFKQVHMSGREGNDSWEIYAREGWTGRDKNVTTFEFVTNAEIDRNGRPLIKDLTARRMKVSRNKDIEVLKKVDDEKDGKQYLDALIDFNAVSNKNKKRNYSPLTADNIKFNPETKKALITGKVRIVNDKMTIRSEMIALDLNKNIATFEGRSSFAKKGSKLFANSATSYFDEDRILMSGSI